MKYVLVAILALSSLVALAEDAPRWYTFGWPLDAEGGPAPRGGATVGVPVTAATEPAGAWRALQEDGLSAMERDSRAILALAGEYRTSFDFLETLTYAPGLDRAQPYQSWATELVFVLEDEPGFISLQHILVMSFVEDGEVRGPFVQKHWRQDWRFEAERRLDFHGQGRWSVSEVDPAPGSWTQTVFQVDDTPRYAASGRWEHHGGYAVWESTRSWRPLPRRESSVRDDYQTLASRHRISVTPNGWTHEQDNLKAVLTDAVLDSETPYLAREQGLARYTRIVDYDFERGRTYWGATGEFWAEVRRWWRDRLGEAGGFELRDRVDGRPLFVPMFDYAGRIEASGDFDAEAARRFIGETLDRYVLGGPAEP